MGCDRGGGGDTAGALPQRGWGAGLYVDPDHFDGPDLPRHLEGPEVAKKKKST